MRVATRSTRFTRANHIQPKTSIKAFRWQMDNYGTRSIIVPLLPNTQTPCVTLRIIWHNFSRVIWHSGEPGAPRSNSYRFRNDRVRSHPRIVKLTCESSQHSSQGCYLENIVSREVFENRKVLHPVELPARPSGLSKSVVFENGVIPQTCAYLACFRRPWCPLLIHVSVYIIPES
jgi:hypothetical protein